MPFILRIQKARNSSRENQKVQTKPFGKSFEEVGLMMETEKN